MVGQLIRGQEPQALLKSWGVVPSLPVVAIVDEVEQWCAVLGSGTAYLHFCVGKLGPW